MKTYNSEESKSIYWLKRQKYIESSDSLGTVSILNWKLVSKVPIDQIKHDKDNYPNESPSRLSCVSHTL